MQIMQLLLLTPNNNSTNGTNIIIEYISALHCWDGELARMESCGYQMFGCHKPGEQIELLLGVGSISIKLNTNFMLS